MELLESRGDRVPFRTPSYVGVLLALLATSTAAPAPLDALQSPADTVAAPRLFAGGSLWWADARGEFAQYVEGGWGVEGHARYALDPSGFVGLRATAGFVQYGRETRQVCFSSTVGCRILLDLTTSNAILAGGVGPELAWPGDRIRPYVYGTAGFAYFATTSSLEGSDDREDFARTNNFTDGTFAWRAGTGLQIRVTDHPVWLDLGAERHWNGTVSYLREGDIIDEPDGSITLRPRRSEADFVTFRVGVSVGIRRVGPGPGAEP